MAKLAKGERRHVERDGRVYLRENEAPAEPGAAKCGAVPACPAATRQKISTGSCSTGRKSTLRLREIGGRLTVTAYFTPTSAPRLAARPV